MGWSCRSEAAKVMERFGQLCVEQTGSSNVWKKEGYGFFMLEFSNREHRDGAITGTMMRFEGDPMGKDSCSARQVGSFRIEPNGEVKRGPAILRRASKEAAPPMMSLRQAIRRAGEIDPRSGS